MPIDILCNSCNKRFRAPDEANGKTVDCPKCGASLDIRRPKEITDAEWDAFFGTTGKSSSGIHRADTSGPADSQPNAPSFPTIITDSPRTEKKSLGKRPIDQIIGAAIIGALFGLATANPGWAMLTSAIRWAVVGSLGVSAYQRCNFIWTQSARLPFILRLMKIATLVWLIGMLFCALIVYFGTVDDVIHDGGNGAVIDAYGDLISKNTLRARAISSAVISGLVIPTLFYVPTMAVLFVFWFIERESSKHDTPTG